MGTPADVAGLAVWLKASSLTASDGDLIATWPDSSGNGRDYAQATSAKRPTYRPTAIGGQPALRFDGADDTLLGNAASLLAMTGSPGFTVFAVLARNSTGTTTRRIWSETKNGSTASSRLTMISFSADMRVGGVRADADAYVEEVYPGAIAASTALVVTAQGDYGLETIRGFRDGTEQTPTSSVSFSAGATGSASNAGSSALASIGGTTGYLGMDLAEFILYPRALNPAERAVVHSYVQDTYGITVADYSAGTVPAAGAAAGSTTTVGTATGSTVRSGSTTGSTTTTGSANGTAPAVAAATGTATGSTAHAGIAAGIAPALGASEGIATGTTAHVGTASGSTDRAGSAAGSVLYVGTASGTAPVVGGASGTAVGQTVTVGTATGTTTSTGAAVGLTAITGQAVGSTSRYGLTAGLTAWTGVAAGSASGASDFRDVTVAASLARQPVRGSLMAPTRTAHLEEQP